MYRPDIEAIFWPQLNTTGIYVEPKTIRFLPLNKKINDYRSLSNYLKEFSDFIHWYEQMFDRKPFIKKSLWPDWNKLKPDYSGRISTILSNRTTSADTSLRWFRTLPTPIFKRITDVIPTETHCVPRSNRYPYHSLAWWFSGNFRFSLSDLQCIH